MARLGRVLAIAAGGAAGWVLWRWRTVGGEPHPTVAGGPLLIAHRGGSALMPENTLEALVSAVQDWGADMLELDVRATADGACVVIHDAMVDRTTNGTGHVRSLLLDEVRELDAGYSFTTDGGRSYPFRDRGVRVPLFDEVLEALPDTPIIVELKSADAQPGLWRAIRRFHAHERVIVAGERSVFRSLFGGYRPLSASMEQARFFYALHRAGLARLARPSFDVVQMPERVNGRQLLSPALIADLHLHGIPVHVWTVNSRADMERLLDWGVDGILTDRPDVLSEVLQVKAGRQPPPIEAPVRRRPRLE